MGQNDACNCLTIRLLSKIFPFDNDLSKAYFMRAFCAKKILNGIFKSEFIH